MKNKYPNYKGKRVNDIKKALKPRDKNILNDFLNYCRITAGEKKVGNIERIMLQVYDVMSDSLSFNLDRLRSFLAVLNQSDKLSSTQNDIKKTLKRFLKWYYKDWNERFAEFRDVKINDERNHKKINPATILNETDIEKLIRKAENLRYKAIIILVYETAGRPEEILKLKWSDVDLEKGSVKLSSSKTGRTRVNPINEAIIHLKRYKQEYPYPSIRADDYMFPSPKSRKEQISPQAVYDYLKNLGLSAINRPIFLYLLRHTRLTPLHQKLSPKAYEKFADHSIDTAIKYYSHLSNDDVREEMLEKIYHIEEVSEEDTIKLKELKDENKQVWKWLEKQSRINKILLEAILKDQELEKSIKQQLKEMFSEKENMFPV